VEPDLEDLINDPIVRLLMRRDNLVPADLLEVVAQARAHLGQPATPPQTKARPAALTNLNSEPDDRGSDSNLNSPTTRPQSASLPRVPRADSPEGFAGLAWTPLGRGLDRIGFNRRHSNATVAVARRSTIALDGHRDAGQ
jgi:hypothetical protein